MATKESTIEYILDQLSGVRDVRARKMFGEYAVYCQDKVVALVCDDELFVKVTEPGKQFIGKQYQEGFPYPGAKPPMHISGGHVRRPEVGVRTCSRNYQGSTCTQA